MLKKLAHFIVIVSLTISAVNGLEFRGDWQQGALILGVTEPDAEIFFEGKSVAVSSQGHFVLALGRDAPEQVSLLIRNNGHEQTQKFSVLQRHYNIQRIEGVPQKTVTPPASVQARISREAAQVKKARKKNTAKMDYLEGFSLPLKGPITGVYGSQRYYNGEPRSPHFGLDIAGLRGAEVVAPAGGVVTLVHNDMYFSGGTLIIDHGYGVSSTFIHLSEILVKSEQRIEAGDAIALVGSTGRATGPHLDWRINWFNVRVDPVLVLEYFPRKTASITE